MKATRKRFPGVSVTLLFVLTAGLPAQLSVSLAAETDDVTVIEMTDKVLVTDTVRFGINLGGDTYYSGAALVKDRARENFEGTSYRQCHFGPGSDSEGASTWFGSQYGDWDKILVGAKYTILSGPSRWTTGTLKGISTKPFMHQDAMKPSRYFQFDQAIEPMPANGGFMVESLRLDEGCLRSLDGFWTSKHNEIVIGDVPENSFGCAALKLNGLQDKAHHRFQTFYQRFGDTNGTWRVRFWAKAAGGEPRLRISPDRYGEPVDIVPSKQWREYERTLTVTGFPEPKDAQDNRMPFFTIEASAGNVLVDDVELWQAGSNNPTVFRDDCIAMLRRFNPGPVRTLQMGGSTVDNTLSPPLKSHRYNSRPNAKMGPYHSQSRDPYSLHELYTLCELIGAEPWYCLPGTLNRQEMTHFIEYLGGPAHVGYGKKRAEMGQPRPWTEVFKTIHVEFGNEAWNNAGSYQCGGFNGPGYWQDLIETGKNSAYYQPNIVFHAAGQASYVGRNEGIMKNAPNADRFSVAPYIIQSLTKDDAERMDTNDRLFRWAFGWAIHRSRDSDGTMRENYELAKQAGIELSIYEVNHHITHGDGPLEPRNRLVTSIGGGLNVANNMLTMMKDHHLRSQCLFSLAQHSYTAHGVGAVRLWGTALCMRKGHERYRPTFLACAIANKVIGGCLVETRHRGEDPTFEATGTFRHNKGVETLRNLPVIWSYGFAEGARRGLILVSLDTAKTRSVAIEFEGRVARGTARQWLLSADRISANNEYEAGDPQVKMTESEVSGFASGKRIQLHPFSMLALEWEVK